MRALIAASSFPRSGSDWRSRFILDMLEALESGRSEDDELAYWGPPGPVPASIRRAASPADERWLDGLMVDGGLAHLLRTRPVEGLSSSIVYLWRLHRALRAARGRVDVIHLNWLQNVLALPRGPEPVLVTVLGSDFGLLRNKAVRVLVRGALERRRCVVAPNAGWMVPALQTAMGDTVEVVAVPFGVSAGWYAIERADSRSRRWLVVARVTRAKMGPLFEWGAEHFSAGDELHLLGPMQETIAIPKWVRYHGPTDPEALRTQWFPSAAGLITLSTHDEGRPQVLLEAMAAGLPVIASRQPAHEDLIRHGVTGFIAGTAGEFNAALGRLSDPGERSRIGSAAREWTATNIGTWIDTAARYRRQYARLMGAEQ